VLVAGGWVVDWRQSSSTNGILKKLHNCGGKCKYATIKWQW
jgi:hypothetical protein